MDKNDKKNFDKAVESLRQYRRYELVDSRNRDLLNSLYVDPLQNDAILNLCLKDNTTVLIGRKGTGKSTIFMRMQNELRVRDDIITCYIDVKNIFDKAKRNYSTIGYIGLRDKTEIETYSLQRKFIIDFITELIKEIEKNYVTLWDKVKSKVRMSKPTNAIIRLKEIRERITDNKHLESVELQIVQDINHKAKSNSSEERDVVGKMSNKTKLAIEGVSSELCVDTLVGMKSGCFEGNEKEYNRIFARIFEITNIIDEIKAVLEEMNLKRLYIILDDYSEIEQTALRMFCDLIVNTLNNNSDNFIKLKISAYPGRVELGELDRQKIDIRYLDYYQLYMYDKRDDMELSATDYTRRIIEKRLEIYTGKNFDYFFDTTKATPDEYYRLIFQMSLNVVRHMGLILDYAIDYAFDNGKRITIANLHESAKRLYEERLKLFFKESEYALMSYNDRIERFQLEDLLNSIVLKAKEIKKDIRTSKYEAVIFDKERGNPHCSHFHISQEFEELLSSLELNFFLSKYNEMSNKTGKKVSIYSLNYGLSFYQNIKWGKPEGNDFRTYFIETPFNYNKLFSNFINNTKKIECSNLECKHIFNISELSHLKKYNMDCPLCRIRNAVKEVPLIEKYQERAEIIENKTNLLDTEQYKFITLAILKDSIVTAQEMAQELDVTVQKIGWISKRLEEEYYYLTKDRSGAKVKYIITDLGKDSI